MNAVQFESNYYTKCKSIDLYVDRVNSRLKILCCAGISDDIIHHIINLAKEEKLEKIVANCRIRQLKPFKYCGFHVEGIIEGFFKGEDAYCSSLFLSKERSISACKEEEDAILCKCANDIRKFMPPLSPAFNIREACLKDIPQIVELFTTVFKTYPSPVFSIDYLERVMNDKVLFKVALHDKKVVSVASADMDLNNLNAEITDCATYPEFRGKGLLSNLICFLEKDMKNKGFHALYSLSRANNPGINLALAKQGYRYSGRLINNCHICGGLEDMNIWVKRLRKQ